MRKILYLLTLTTAVFYSLSSTSATISSNGTGGGSFNSSGTWQGGVIPTSSDDILILDGDAVNIDIATSVTSATVQADANANGYATLVVNAGISFTVSGDVHLSQINANGNNTFPELKTSISTTCFLTIQGDVYFNSDDDNEVPTLTIANQSTLRIEGDFILNSLNSTISIGLTNSTVEYSGSGSQTIVAGTYGKLISSGTGARVLDNSTSIILKNNSATCFTPGTNSYTTTGSTIEFSGTGTQTIPAFNYNNLTIGSSGTKTLVNGGTIGIAGSLTFAGAGTNTIVATNNTVNFNGTAAQTLSFGSRTGATFNNLTFNNTHTSGIALGQAINTTLVAGDLIVQTGIFSNGGFSITGNTGKTFQVNNGCTFTLAGVSSTFPTGFTFVTLQTGSTVDYNGSGSQTIFPLNYYNLTSSNSGARVMGNTGTIGIAGTYTPGSNSYTVVNSTINFNGTSDQTVPLLAGATYNDLQLNNTGTNGATLAAAVTASNILGNISVQTGIFDNGGFAIAGNGTATFQVDNGATFEVGGTSSTPTGFGTFSCQTGSTVNFNGTTQNIAAPGSYHHLTISGSNTKTATAGFDVNGNLTISAGTFDLNAQTITIGGNFVNNATFTHSSGTVTFDGSANQNISGSASPTTFHDIIVSTTGGNTTFNEGTVALENLFTLTSGSLFDADGASNDKTFTIKSSATKTAQIADLGATPSNFSGQVTLERYISDKTDWRQLGCPIQGQTLAEWMDDFAMSGFTGAGNAGNTVTVYTFDETQVNGPAYTNAYTAATNITNPTSFDNGSVLGKGFICYVGDNSPGQNMTAFAADMTGNIISGTQSTNVTCSNGCDDGFEGYNLIANPYPSSIVFNNLTRTNVLQQYDIYDEGSGNYAHWNGAAGTNGATGNIASSQAFWVTCDNAAGGSVQFDEDDKASTIDNNFLKTSITQIPFLKAKLTSSINTYSDELLVGFTPTANSNFVRGEDGWKVYSYTQGAPHLASVALNNQDMASNMLPDTAASLVVPIRAKVAISGNYTLNFDLSALSNNYCAILEDKLTNTFTDLKVNTTYSFYIADSTATPRFFIHFTSPQLIASSVNYTNPSCSSMNDGMVAVTPTSNGPWKYIWKDSTGTIVRQTNNSSTPDTLTNATPGNYYVSIYSLASCSYGADTAMLTLDYSAQANAVFNSSNDTLYLSNGANVNFFNTSTNATVFNWSFGDGATSTNLNPTHTYTATGVYPVTLIVENPNCMSLDTMTSFVSVFANPLSVNSFILSPEPIVSYDNNKVYLTFNYPTDENITITALNTLGQVVYKTESLKIRNQKVALNLNNSSEQFYLLKIESKEKILVKKIINY